MMKARRNKTAAILPLCITGLPFVGKAGPDRPSSPRNRPRPLPAANDRLIGQLDHFRLLPAPAAFN